MNDRDRAAPEQGKFWNLCNSDQNSRDALQWQTELRALLWRLELVYTNNLPGVLLRTLLVPTSVFVKATLQINVWQRNLPVIPGIVVFLHRIIIDDQNRKSLEFRKKHEQVGCYRTGRRMSEFCV
jgi:hypothetical protein